MYLQEKRIWKPAPQPDNGGFCNGHIRSDSMEHVRYDTVHGTRRGDSNLSSLLFL